MLIAVCNNCEAGTSPEFSPKIKKGFCTWNNQLLIIAADTNLNRKRSIKGGFIIIFKNQLTFIFNKPFKQKIL